MIMSFVARRGRRFVSLNVVAPLPRRYNFTIRNNSAFSHYLKRHSPTLKKPSRMLGYSHRT